VSVDAAVQNRGFPDDRVGMHRGARQSRSIFSLIAALVVTVGFGCGTGLGVQRNLVAEDAAVDGRAQSERVSRLEAEVALLRSELAEAERELVAVESGLRDSRTRADAVSALAEARIQVERATKRAPWRASLLEEAAEKLEEAERQVEAENFGSAFFFASRAGRIARNTMEEARTAKSKPGARAIGGRRVNLREGPSTSHAVLTVLLLGTPVFPEREKEDWILVRTTDGFVGWVHRPLIR
jgi:hypothetical protein